jgi:HlyD family secretion protein
MVKTKRARLALLLAAALCAFIIVMLWVRWKHDAATSQEAGHRVPNEVSCLGRIVPGERVIRVTAATPSVVKELRVKRRDQVKKGQILAVLIDYDASLAALRETEANVAVAESQLARVKAGQSSGAIAAQEAVVARLESEMKISNTKYDRSKLLFDNDAISRSQYEDAELSLEGVSKGLQGAKETLASMKEVRPVDVVIREKGLEAARTGRDEAKAKLELCLVRSPIDGQVVEINTYPGERVGPAGLLDMAGRVLMVDAEVYVSDINRVRVGASAAITGDGFKGEVKGTVMEVLDSVINNSLVDPNPLATSDKRVIKARIRVDEPAKVASLLNSQVFVKIFP